jgi:1-acyl-sn-glycerol-3-phosphate acyltransferase
VKLQLSLPLFTIALVQERSKQTRIGNARPPRADDEHRPAEPERLQQALVARLDALERHVADEIAPRPRPDGSIQQFVGDVTREARDAASRLLRALTPPRTVMARLVGALASPRANESGVDEDLRDALAEALRPLARSWLGLRLCTDIPLPQRGGVLIAFNRSGWPFPTEGMLVAAAVAERARRHDVYVLWDAAVATKPALGSAMRRVGVLAAEAGAARSLLARGALVVCFPEGGAAREKIYADRYRLAPFEDAFVLDEARAAGAAVVPGAIVGHEESYPVLGHVAGVPLTPVFPLAGALGLLPLPLGWRVHIGAPVHHDEDGGREVAVNAGERYVLLRSRMQAMLGDMLAERRSIVRG